MPLLDWSMNIVGYPPHQRSGSAVVGVTHMSTHTALRVAEALGLYTGWLQAEGEQPQLEGIEVRDPAWVVLAELFVEQRVAYTEGVVSGSLVFGAAVPANGQPPRDRSLIAWTEAGGRPWMQIVDNENVYFGGLDEAGIDLLLSWFLCQKPLDLEWREQTLDPDAGAALRRGLFQHGWSRNGDLVVSGWRPTVDLWAGVHTLSPLEHDDLKRLSALQTGYRVSCKAGQWRAKRLTDEDCPLDDETGRATPRI